MVRPGLCESPGSDDGIVLCWLRQGHLGVHQWHETEWGATERWIFTLRQRVSDLRSEVENLNRYVDEHEHK